MRDRCAHVWAGKLFKNTTLPDRRLASRGRRISAAMARRPQASLPGQARGWADTMATYRFLHNDRVTPADIQAGAIELTRAACTGSVTLMVHDQTQLKPVYADDMTDTKLMQHTVLAVDGDGSPEDDGRIIGLMHQRWFDDPKPARGETRAQRNKRWTRSRAWPEAVEAVGQPTRGGRWIHVADREADDFQMFAACDAAGHGFVIRAQHDRCLEGGGRLRETMAQQPVAREIDVRISKQNKVGVKAPPASRRAAKSARTARCALRFAKVTLAPPAGDARYDKPRAVWAVHVREIDPPADVNEPVDWLLLTSEPVENVDDALRVVGWYRRRWVIEEFHRSQKTGCRLEKTQLRDRAAFERLAAIAALVGVRLLQLRDAADDDATADQPAAAHIDDALWVQIVAHHAKHDDVSALTVRQFYHTLARLGGWLGRKSDGRPGWQTLWRGVREVAAQVEGARLAQKLGEAGGDVYKG